MKWLQKAVLPEPLIESSSEVNWRDKTIAQLREHEGLKDHVYWDGKKEHKGDPKHGRWAFGYGQNIFPDMPEYGLPEGSYIPRSRSEEMFSKRVKKAEDEARSVINNFDSLPDPWKSAFTNMQYQHGTDGLRAYDKMLKAVNRPNPNPAKIAAAMKASVWATQTPKRAEEVRNLILKGW